MNIQFGALARPLQGILRLAVAMSVGGTLSACVQMVKIKDRPVTEMNEHNAPMKIGRHGEGTLHSVFTLRGPTQTFPYDSLPWRFARLPYIKSSTGIPLFLDTGLPDPALPTLDLVSREGWPARLDKTVSVAYIPRLEFGGIIASHLAGIVIESQYQVRLFGAPLYRASGVVLGNSLLAQAHFLAFDNARREATIGFEHFVPAPGSEWTFYPFDRNREPWPASFREGWPPSIQPWIHLPIGGKRVHLMPDSGGGRHLILNPEQWKEIASGLEVLQSGEERYPGWGGFRIVDTYRVKNLPLGPANLRNETVWVRRATRQELPPTLGLGLFPSQTVVWDFRKSGLWIGRTKSGGPRSW